MIVSGYGFRTKIYERDLIPRRVKKQKPNTVFMDSDHAKSAGSAELVFPSEGGPEDATGGIG